MQQCRYFSIIPKMGIRMNNRFIPLLDMKYLGKREVIESIIDQLKNIAPIEHYRHRSLTNFLVNLVAGLVAHGFADKKTSVVTCFQIAFSRDSSQYIFLLFIEDQDFRLDFCMKTKEKTAVIPRDTAVFSSFFLKNSN